MCLNAFSLWDQRFKHKKHEMFYNFRKNTWKHEIPTVQSTLWPILFMCLNAFSRRDQRFKHLKHERKVLHGNEEKADSSFFKQISQSFRFF